MAAGLGFKTFNTGEVLTAADVNGYLMQGVLVFATEAARNSAITSPQEGQFAFTKDNNSLWYYTGAAWAASGATGDIEGVTAGTGISGGGTTGTVTITNSMATEIDAKGDLVVGTGADTFARLAVGTNDYVLTAASGETTGLKWAAPAAAAFKGVRAYKTNDQTFTNNTTTAITFASESFDTDGYHSTTTNTDRITIPAGLGGKYLVILGVQWNNNATGYREMSVQKNGTTLVLKFAFPGFNVGNNYFSYSSILEISAGDYFNATAYQNSGGDLIMGGGEAASFFTVQYLGA